MWRARALLAAMLTMSVTAPVSWADTAPIPPLRPVVLDRIYHDPTAFTEGLFIDGTSLYESTGMAGQSQLRELDPVTGQLRRAVPLPPTYFGEGIADADDHIWQLTYQNGVAIDWDKATLTPRREVPFVGEGWGLCRDGDRLIRSDGTARLHFHSVDDMHETGSMMVTYKGGQLEGLKLNSLDCSGNDIWANAFPLDQIVHIDATTGFVQAVVFANDLLDIPDRTNVQVLNGIAHFDNGDFLVTGKDWPSMYRVRFEPA